MKNLKWNENAMNGAFNNILILLKKHAFTTQSFLRYNLSTYSLVYIVDAAELCKMPKNDKKQGKKDELETLLYADENHKLLKLKCSEIEMQNIHLELKHKIELLTEI